MPRRKPINADTIPPAQKLADNFAKIGSFQLFSLLPRKVWPRIVPISDVMPEKCAERKILPLISTEVHEFCNPKAKVQHVNVTMGCTDPAESNPLPSMIMAADNKRGPVRSDDDSLLSTTTPFGFQSPLVNDPNMYENGVKRTVAIAARPALEAATPAVEKAPVTAAIPCAFPMIPESPTPFINPAFAASTQATVTNFWVFLDSV
mmetsp:Transcript_33748/g.52561  ORF Transcript_33748/g.52561 Transcript_33748/m.52561 type:complete len:205 (-) Transcript_33748:422-1036(-)